MTTQHEHGTPRPPTTNATADAPASAFQLTSGPLQFMEANADSPDLRPFVMVARSAEPIEHWYWGRIVHDFDGMQLRKDRCPIDWRHDETVELGFADAFEVTDDGLQLSGSLIVLEDNDRADQVHKRGQAGMPYEASIDWIGEGTELEWIPEDVTTEVNGRQFDGPGYVARKWPLRAAAICPYGADAATATQFSDAADTPSVRVFTQTEQPTVSKETNTNATEAETNGDDTKQHANTPAPEKKTDAAAVPAGTITPDTLKQFNDAFGAKAMEYLQAGLSFDAARLQFADHRATLAEDEAKQLREQLGERDAELKTANDKLKQFGEGNGQAAPLNGENPADGDAPEKAKIFSGGKAVRKSTD